MSDPTGADDARLAHIPRLGVVLLLTLTVLLAPVVLGGAAAAHTGDGGAHHHDGAGMQGGMGTFSWWGWLVGPLFMILGIGAVVGIVALVLRRTGSGDGATAAGTDTALAALRERYARGELDDEEFERRRERLRESGRTE